MRKIMGHNGWGSFSSATRTLTILVYNMLQCYNNCNYLAILQYYNFKNWYCIQYHSIISYNILININDILYDINVQYLITIFRHNISVNNILQYGITIRYNMMLILSWNCLILSTNCPWIVMILFVSRDRGGSSSPGRLAAALAPKYSVSIALSIVCPLARESRG